VVSMFCLVGCGSLLILLFWWLEILRWFRLGRCELDLRYYCGDWCVEIDNNFLVYEYNEYCWVV